MLVSFGVSSCALMKTEKRSVSVKGCVEPLMPSNYGSRRPAQEDDSCDAILLADEDTGWVPITDPEPTDPPVDPPAPEPTTPPIDPNEPLPLTPGNAYRNRHLKAGEGVSQDKRPVWLQVEQKLREGANVSSAMLFDTLRAFRNFQGIEEIKNLRSRWVKRTEKINYYLRHIFRAAITYEEFIRKKVDVAMGSGSQTFINHDVELYQNELLDSWVAVVKNEANYTSTWHRTFRSIIFLRNRFEATGRKSEAMKLVDSYIEVARKIEVLEAKENDDFEKGLKVGDLDLGKMTPDDLMKIDLGIDINDPGAVSIRIKELKMEQDKIYEKFANRIRLTQTNTMFSRDELLRSEVQMLKNMRELHVLERNTHDLLHEFIRAEMTMSIVYSTLQGRYNDQKIGMSDVQLKKINDLFADPMVRSMALDPENPTVSFSKFFDKKGRLKMMGDVGDEDAKLPEKRIQFRNFLQLVSFTTDMYEPRASMIRENVQFQFAKKTIKLTLAQIIIGNLRPATIKRVGLAMIRDFFGKSTDQQGFIDEVKKVIDPRKEPRLVEMIQDTIKKLPRITRFMPGRATPTATPGSTTTVDPNATPAEGESGWPAGGQGDTATTPEETKKDEKWAPEWEADNSTSTGAKPNPYLLPYYGLEQGNGGLIRPWQIDPTTGKGYGELNDTSSSGSGWGWGTDPNDPDNPAMGVTRAMIQKKYDDYLAGLVKGWEQLANHIMIVQGTLKEDKARGIYRLNQKGLMDRFDMLVAYIAQKSETPADKWDPEIHRLFASPGSAGLIRNFLANRNGDPRDEELAYDILVDTIDYISWRVNNRNNRVDIERATFGATVLGYPLGAGAFMGGMWLLQQATQIFGNGGWPFPWP